MGNVLYIIIYIFSQNNDVGDYFWRNHSLGVFNVIIVLKIKIVVF